MGPLGGKGGRAVCPPQQVSLRLPRGAQAGCPGHGGPDGHSALCDQGEVGHAAGSGPAPPRTLPAGASALGDPESPRPPCWLLLTSLGAKVALASRLPRGACPYPWRPRLSPLLTLPAGGEGLDRRPRVRATCTAVGPRTPALGGLLPRMQPGSARGKLASLQGKRCGFTEASTPELKSRKRKGHL